MVILGALKCQLLITFFKNKVLITQNESFQRKNIRRWGRKPGKLFSSHLPLKNSACLSLKTVKSDVLLLPFVRSTSCSQLFFIILSSFSPFFSEYLLLNCQEEKNNRKRQNKRAVFHILCLNPVEQKYCEMFTCKSVMQTPATADQKASDVFKLATSNYS